MPRVVLFLRSVCLPVLGTINCGCTAALALLKMAVGHLFEVMHVGQIMCEGCHPTNALLV